MKKQDLKMLIEVVEEMIEKAIEQEKIKQIIGEKDPSKHIRLLIEAKSRGFFDKDKCFTNHTKDGKYYKRVEGGKADIKEYDMAGLGGFLWGVHLIVEAREVGAHKIEEITIFQCTDNGTEDKYANCEDAKWGSVHNYQNEKVIINQ